MNHIVLCRSSVQAFMVPNFHLQVTLIDHRCRLPRVGPDKLCQLFFDVIHCREHKHKLRTKV